MSAATEKVFNICLNEMFRRVGRRTTESFLKKDRWYMTCSWTMAEEEDFRKWMVATIRKKLRWPRRTAEKEASMFLLCYSWRHSPDGCMAVWNPRSARARRLEKG